MRMPQTIGQHRLLVCLLLYLAIAAHTPSAIATTLAQTNDIAVRPATVTVQAGDIFTVDVMIEGDVQTLGADFWLNFDPALLEVVDSGGSPANQVVAGDFDTTIFNSADNSAGLIRFGAANFAGTLAPPIRVATIRFRARAYTTDTPLSFDPANTEITDGSGVSILGSLLNGHVSIQDTDTLTVQPSISLVNASGDTWAVDVVVAGDVPALGADFWLTFDPTHMVVVDATGTPTDTIEPGDFDTTVFNTADNGAGLIRFGAANFGGALAPPIHVATIRLRAESATPSTWLALDSANSDITDENGLSILGQAQDGHVTIFSAACNPDADSTTFVDIRDIMMRAANPDCWPYLPPIASLWNQAWPPAAPVSGAGYLPMILMGYAVVE